MKTNFLRLVLVLCAAISSYSAKTQSNSLHDTIARLDSLFFSAYNNCDLKTQEAFFADDIEFFHDRSGLDTSRQNILAATRKFICGKVQRNLVKGSIEVSPIPGYGAVEMGMHSFVNNQENNVPSKPSKFIIIWRNKGDRWVITKVISLH